MLLGITKLITDGEILEDSKQIEDHIIHFYKNLYSKGGSNLSQQMHYLIAKCIHTLLSDDENNSLIKCLDHEEIRHVSFALNGDKATSLDGYRYNSIMLVGTLLVLMLVRFYNSFFSLIGFYMG